MTQYTEEELQQMQQEAVQRVLELQQRARRTAAQQGWTGSALPRGEEASPAPSDPAPRREPTAAAPPPHPNSPQTSPLAGLLHWAGGERGILLALLALLMGEGADPTLLLALVYLTLDSPNHAAAAAESDGTAATAELDGTQPYAGR